MQVEDGAAHVGDGVVDGGAGAGHVGRGRGELLAGGEQALHRLVVQRLGQPAALAVLGVQRLRDELAAALGQLLDRGPAAVEHDGEQPGRQCGDRQVGQLCELERARALDAPVG